MKFRVLGTMVQWDGKNRKKRSGSKLSALYGLQDKHPESWAG